MILRPHLGALLLPLLLVFAGLGCDAGTDATATIVPPATATATAVPRDPGDGPIPTPIHAAATLLPSVAGVVDKVKPAVVSIAVTVEAVSCDIFGRCRTVEQEAEGTGVLFDQAGYIVTNNHVVEGAVKIQVFLVDERTFQAELIGRDPASDLAVIKIEGDGYPVVGFANPDDLRVGDWVIAIGNALALPGGPTVTLGIVGALDRSIATEDSRLYNMIQTDAAINFGNSGGPLVNLYGQVVGINTAKTQTGEGIGFSVSTFDVVPVVASIREHGRVVFAWLGIGVKEVTPVIAAQEGLSVNRGVLVDGLDSNGPAARGGLHSGDIIVAFDAVEVDSVRQLQQVVRGYTVGYETEVTVVRGKDTSTFRITLEEQPRGL